MTRGAPTTTSLAPRRAHSIACSIDSPPTAWTGNRHRPHDIVQLVERAQTADHGPLVEADVVDDDVDAKPLHPSRALDAIVGAEIVPHHPDVEIAAGLDDAPDGRFVRAAHDDHEVGARLGHHLGLEISAVHRLQIGHDRMSREARAKLLDGMKPFGEEQRCAGFQPVDARFDADGCRVDRFVHRREIERQLDDGMGQRLQVHRESDSRGRG